MALLVGLCAVSGLQVGEVGDDWFTVYLIPETLRTTVLRSKGLDDSVNIEIDSQTQASLQLPAYPPFEVANFGVLNSLNTLNFQSVLFLQHAHHLRWPIWPFESASVTFQGAVA